MKKLAYWIFPLSLLPLVSCVQTSSTNSDHLSFSTDQTVMLHWLEVDPEGVVREAETDGNTTKHKEPFSGKAIETFEQSPTKSVSSWKKGKRHGITTEYFYNGRKRRIISYEDGERNGGISFSSSSPKVSDQIEMGPKGRKQKSTILKIEAAVMLTAPKPKTTSATPCAQMGVCLRTRERFLDIHLSTRLSPDISID